VGYDVVGKHRWFGVIDGRGCLGVRRYRGFSLRWGAGWCRIDQSEGVNFHFLVLLEGKVNPVCPQLGSH